MGFGSYDESEQESGNETEYDEEDAVNVHQNDHDGEIDFQSDADEDELLDKLQQMKD